MLARSEKMAKIYYTQITDKRIARLVAQELIQASFFHRSDKVEDKKVYLQIIVFIFNSWLTYR